MRTEFLFAVWPYAAVLLCVAGLVVRCVLARRGGPVRVSAELDLAWELLGKSKLWRISLVLLILGHLSGLLLPQKILLWNQVALRLYLLEGFALAAGIAALGGWVGMMQRHFEESAREQSAGSAAVQIADTLFLASFFAALFSGLCTAIFYRWASSWSVSILTPYALSLLSGHPSVELAAEMPFLVQLHLFSGLAVLAILPFTRLALILIAAFNRGLDFVLLPISAVVELSRRALAEWLERQNPAAWIWPEED